jgi:hypothetical protein
MQLDANELIDRYRNIIGARIAAAAVIILKEG